jgi:antitoxin component of RelBE/YafQ-DinJ toxin-antitoxin module
MQWVQIAASLGQDGQMAIRTSAIADHVADKMGIPAELRTSQEERQQMAEQMAQMQAAQMAMQAGEVAGE